MSDRIDGIGLAFAPTLLAAALALAGCGDDGIVAASSGTGTTGASTSADTTGAGHDVTGGSTAPGGSGASGDTTVGLDDTGTTTGPSDTTGRPMPDMGGGMDCPHEGPPVIDPSALDECAPACAGAHCVPAALIPPEQQALLEPCSTGGGDGFCTPDLFIETAGNFLLETCESAGGAEGRCLSACIPQVSEQAALLPQSTCADGDLCVPCFDPFTQIDTGACTFTCDPGPTEPPLMITCPYMGPAIIDATTLPDCSPACGGAHCLPDTFVPPALQPMLEPCAGGFCTPDTLIESGGQGLPTTCTSVAGAEGRCMSTCLPDVAAQAQFLPQDICLVDEVCVPCFDPTAADPTAPTGVCEIACDMAVDPPVLLSCPWLGPPVLDPAVLPDCAPVCGGAHCLDAGLVPAPLQPQLDACPGGFCVPDPMIETAGNYVPPSCTAFPATTAEGRCLSECLPDVAAQVADLQQDTCAMGEWCVPCTDPFDGMDTGACTQACDAPVDPPYTFPTCCPNAMGTDEATCVPTALIDPGDAMSLLQQTCPMDMLCVPHEYLPTPLAPIQMCASAFGAGACVSNCTDLGLGGIFGQSDCTDNHTCIPCAFGAPGCP